MSIELMGVLTIVLGLAVLGASVRLAFYLMVLSTVFGAAAAFSLPGLGGASMLVPSVFLVFFGIRLFMAVGEGPVFSSFAPDRPGFWLLLLTVYGLFTAFFFPRLLEGVTETMTVTRSMSGLNSISLIPLESSSNNITQSVYALGGLVCFAFTFAYFRRAGSLSDLVGVMLVVCVVNLVFAVLDVATYATGTAYLLDFVRTANYALLTGSEKGGFKRISGTFAEASAFAGFTLVLFGVMASLWLDRVRPFATGSLAALLLIALLLSTSATAYVGLAVVLSFLVLRSAAASVRRKSTGRPAFIACFLVALPLIFVAVWIFLPGVADDISGFFDEMLFNKLESQSGRERFMWNAMAFQAFKDTWGLGAGLGSSRASSYLLVLMSNVGVLGTVLFFLFIGSILLGGKGSTDEGVVRAAKTGLIGNLAEAFTSGTVFDLGLMFYLLAGTVAASHFSAVRRPVAAGRQPVGRARRLGEFAR